MNIPSHASPLRARKLPVLWLALALSCLAPQALRAQSSPPPAAQPDYSREAFISEDDTTRVAFENDGTSVRESTSRIRIQSGAGVQRFGVLTFAYEGSTGTMDIDYARVRKPDGTTVVTPPDTVQDMPSEITRQAPFYSDLREKHLAVKGLSVGDVLEFQTHWRTTKPLVPGQFWFAFNFSHDFILLHEELQISVPRERAVKWKSSEFKPVISEAGTRRIFTWTTSELDRKSSDQERLDRELASYQLQRGKLPPPEVQLSTFQSWQDIGRWYLNLQQDRATPSPEIRAKAAELTKGLTGDDAKLRAIYNFVSTQFRYIGVSFGIGRYQPHSAAEVLGNQYGDCKDKHTLFASLLDAAGIHAFPALINSSHDLDPDVPSPSQFDHLITVVPRGGHLLWLDTTPEVAPFSYLLSSLRDKRALVVDADNSALTNTPAASPLKSLQIFRMNASISDTGTLTGTVDRSLQGNDNEVLLRSAFRSLPMPQWKDLIQRISYTTGFAGDVSDVSAGTPEKIDEPFHFSYTYTRKEYPEWPNSRIASPLPPIMLPVSDKDEKPSTPILLGSVDEIKLESLVKLPPGYSPQLPRNVDLDESFAEYHAAYSIKDGALLTERHLILKAPEVPLAQYDAYKKFTKTVSDDYALFVALSSAKSSPESFQDAIANIPLSDNAQAASAYQDAQEQFQRHDLQAELASLRRAVEIDPKFTRAWLWLGETYMAIRRFDDSVQAFRAAIEADPKQPVAYKALGFTLLGAEKYEEDIPVLQELLKLTPNDTSASGALASALFGLKRYSEAVPVLEAAVSLNPLLPALSTQLGVAYLHSGKDEKALASFEKAIALDARPVALNNIAYQLAEANKHLDVALKYAQKAVYDEELASQDTDLTDLKTEDLGHTSSLAAFWDTLGWVHFRNGTLSQAEKYLQAAWLLSLSGTEADHLGQLYERQGKKQAAVRMYQHALFAFNLQPAARAAEQETRSRLERLQPGASAGNHFTQITDEVNAIRTIKLPRVLQGTATAEFFVVLTQDLKDSSLDVADAKFISGSQELRSAGNSLLSAPFAFPFPDQNHPNVLRRGILSCYQRTGCSFTLINPADVLSVQ